MRSSFELFFSFLFTLDLSISILIDLAETKKGVILGQINTVTHTLMDMTFGYTSMFV